VDRIGDSFVVSVINVVVQKELQTTQQTRRKQIRMTMPGSLPTKLLLVLAFSLGFSLAVSGKSCARPTATAFLSGQIPLSAAPASLQVDSGGPPRKVTALNSHNRRNFLTKSVFSAGALLLPTVARADVADGTALPDGAAQFQRIVRMQQDLEVRPHKSMKTGTRS
jgi:hypothetical protein